jgi:hypothetical protein
MNAITKAKTETPKTLLGALALALPGLGAAKKGNLNPHFKSKYADLGAVIEAIRPIAEHGLWFRQVSHDAESGVSIETFYIHDSGELSAGKVFVPADKNNAQGYGSAQTYARRYGLQQAFGLATEDDDGNAAAAAPPKKQEAHSKLKTQVRAFVHDMEGCGDWDTWIGLRECKETQDLIAEVKAKLPQWWEGGPDMPDEFVPLHRRIEILEANFADEKADLARA